MSGFVAAKTALFLLDLFGRLYLNWFSRFSEVINHMLPVL
jgi:hypothetical protein